jgi:hypothetical protein
LGNPSTHGYLFVDLIRGELTTHRFFIGAPPNDTSEIHSLSSTKTNSCADVSLANMIYLTKRQCDTPVFFQLDPEAFTRFDESIFFQPKFLTIYFIFSINE